MIFGITTQQQKIVQYAIQKQNELEKELNFSLSCTDITLKKDNSLLQPIVLRPSFSSFKSDKPEEKNGIRKLKTMDSLKDLSKEEKKIQKKNQQCSKFFRILENLLNC